jgi:Pyruvate/2-oxoacid:ferredoxin oxidoreductase delta subunit
MFNNCTKKLEIIYENVHIRKKGKFETRGILVKLLFAPLLLIIKPVFLGRYKKLSNSSHLPFNELIPLADKSFHYDEKCNGCGICTRVCPINNIKMVENRPVWQHHCENCFACYGWCPEEAIHGDIVSYNERYHHPEVKISDMLRKN